VTELGVSARLEPNERRNQIIIAADAVLAGRDPAEVTFEEIAEQAGVSRALVYNYFGDKGSLLAEVLQRRFQELEDRTRAEIDGDLPPAERFRGVIRLWLEWARSDSRRLLAGTDHASQHPAVQEVRRQRFAALAVEWGDCPEARLAVTCVMAVLEAATRDEIENADLDIDRMTLVVYTLLWTGVSALDELGIGPPERRANAISLAD